MGLTTADTAQSPQGPDMLSLGQKNTRSLGAFMGLSSAPGLCFEEKPLEAPLLGVLTVS